MNTSISFAINGIQHIGIPVTNIQASQAFYERLGFHNAMQQPFSHAQGQGIAIMMQRDAVIIELYQFPDPVLPSIKARADGHVDHVAFDVKDIDQVFSEMKAAGFNVLEPAPVFLQFWNKGCKYFNITGPDGERLEFNEIL